MIGFLSSALSKTICYGERNNNLCCREAFRETKWEIPYRKDASSFLLEGPKYHKQDWRHPSYLAPSNSKKWTSVWWGSIFNLVSSLIRISGYCFSNTEVIIIFLWWLFTFQSTLRGSDKHPFSLYVNTLYESGTWVGYLDLLFTLCLWESPFMVKMRERNIGLLRSFQRWILWPYYFYGY